MGNFEDEEFKVLLSMLLFLIFTGYLFCMLALWKECKDKGGIPSHNILLWERCDSEDRERRNWLSS